MSSGAKPAGSSPYGAPRRIYAVGDLHGRSDLLRRLLSLIAEDAASIPPGARTATQPSVCVFLGDYIDSVTESEGVVEMLAGNPLPGFETIFLKGNHGDFFFAFLRAKITGNPCFITVSK
ncbi:MAG: metallophosphoesterase [Rhodospirillaceae bacterium]